ncbi:inositol monophosphatase [Campylobacterota bacterium]|nr:inositol monophosphatase [Campylobacterota bacterium]
MRGFEEAVFAANREISELVQGADDSIYAYAGGKIGFGGDKSLKIDLIAENIFIKYLSEFGRINSEECGHIGNGEDEIVIDPIDGSSNIASGLPYFGTSVALKRRGVAIISIVCNIASGECFVRNPNALFRRFLSGEKCLSIHRQFTPLVGIFEKAYSHPQMAEVLRQNGIKFRSPGALALSLAYAHSVRFVLSAGKHREYDIIAGLHIDSDLHRYESDKLLIVSQETAIFEQLVALFVEGGL